MKIRLLAAASLFSLLVPAAQAVTLMDADSLWLFDGGTIGNAATAGQIIDSSGNGHTVSTSNIANLSWVAGPSAGPYGGSPQSASGHAIKFAPTVTQQNPGSANADSVSAATFQSINASVSGSSTMVTRLRWDGAIPTLDDGTNQWLISNGFGGWNESELASRGYMFGLSTTGNLYYYTAAAGAGQTASGASHSYIATGLALNVGEWYDIAMVLNDLGDSSKTTGQVTFYAVGADGVLKTFTSGTNVWVSPTSNTVLQLGSETPGNGAGNNRKSFNGAFDYLALFDTALTQAEVTAIFAAPEPGRALLLCGGFLAFLARRRRTGLSA